jgi:hypothetical protein
VILLEEAWELNPKDPDAPFTMAVWQAWLGQNSAYEATRQRLLLQTEGTDNAGAADRGAKSYCLRASTNAALLAKALSLARQAVKLG